MDVSVALTTDEIIRGLKHYRRIARQDIMQAEESGNPERITRHAESRRQVYHHLTEYATSGTPAEVVNEALRCYRQLPFVTGTPDDDHVEVKGQENALENFFLMINLAPRIRREARSQRSKPQNGQVTPLKL